MVGTWCILMILLSLTGAESRSVTVSVRHRQHFSVKDIVKRSYIRLSDKHELELGLCTLRPEIKVTKNVSESSQSSINEPNLASEKPGGRGESGNAPKNMEGDLVDVEDELEEAFDDEDDTDDDDIGMYLDSIDKASLGERKDKGGHNRVKRRAREQWRQAAMETNTDKKATPTLQDDDWHNWEAVTDEDIAAGRSRGLTETAEYLGITLLSVAGFIFVGICFIRDPVACVFAFGTGCPCCLICCPCIRAFTDKYLDTKKLVRDSMNKYMPGVIVKEDGSMDFYEPTSEEIEILHEIIEEIEDG